MNSENFNIFIVDKVPQGSLSLFLDQCDGFTFSLGRASYSIPIQASGMTMTESIAVASSSTFEMDGQNDYFTTLQVRGYGQGNDSLGTYDTTDTMLEQILSRTGIIIFLSLTVSWGLGCGVYVLSSSAQAASSTMNGFATYLRERLEKYENVSISYFGERNDPLDNSATPG